MNIYLLSGKIEKVSCKKPTARQERKQLPYIREILWDYCHLLGFAAKARQYCEILSPARTDEI